MMDYGMSEAPLIAIVDDDAMVCEATKDLIETFGFNARTFTSAGEFLSSDVVSGTGTVNLSGRVSRMQAMAVCVGNL
jgi:FixJ family two-component response regulator